MASDELSAGSRAYAGVIRKRGGGPRNVAGIFCIVFYNESRRLDPQGDIGVDSMGLFDPERGG